MSQIFITGVGSGLGEALAKAYLDRGDTVFTIGRKRPETLNHLCDFHFLSCDLSITEQIADTVQPFIDGIDFDLAILNAGMLGPIKTLIETEQQEIETVMNLNVWANKTLIDLLLKKNRVKQVVGISSGAAVNGSKGWGAYSLSKSALNMLLKVYAKEHGSTHFTALAPGVIRTPMVEHILFGVDETLYPSAKRLKEGYIQSPEEAANNLLQTFPKLTSYESGSFLDIRTMD